MRMLTQPKKPTNLKFVGSSLSNHGKHNLRTFNGGGMPLLHVYRYLSRTEGEPTIQLPECRRTVRYHSLDGVLPDKYAALGVRSRVPHVNQDALERGHSQQPRQVALAEVVLFLLTETRGLDAQSHLVCPLGYRGLSVHLRLPREVTHLIFQCVAEILPVNI